MALTRSQLLKELLPGINALFGLEYAKYKDGDWGYGEQEKQKYSIEVPVVKFKTKGRYANLASRGTL